MQETSSIHRNDYHHFHPITTRWMDNDVFGHVNNVTYYSYFDTAVNRYLIEQGGFEFQNTPIVGYVVHSSCDYRSSIAFPDTLEIGINVKKLGNSSVTYGLAVFKKGNAEAAAVGSFVHVFVNRMDNKAVPIPSPIRTALQKLMG